MLILLSPAKTLNFSPRGSLFPHSVPRFLEQGQQLGKYLASKTKEEIKTMMKVSDALVEVNYQRFQEFETAEQCSVR